MKVAASPALLAAAVVLAAASLRAQAQAPKRRVIGMSQCNLGRALARADERGHRRRRPRSTPSLKVVFKDAQNDSLTQRAQVEEFVSAGGRPDHHQPQGGGAAHRSRSPRRWTPAIPVIVLDRAVLGDKYTCFIGADNKQIGREAGEWIAADARRQGARSSSSRGS